MSSSTALLSRPNKKDEHPIFLRVCHSPWRFISQKALVGLRSVIALYMFPVFIFAIYYEIAKQKKGFLILFEFHNIVWVLQLIYHLTTAVWTFMHLHYPHHASQTQTSITRVQKLFSPPRQDPNLKNRIFFSILYTAAIAFPHPVTLIHWLIEVPYHHEPLKDIFTRDWKETFFVVNFFIVNSVIALIENIALSSIRRQTPIWTHSVGLTIIQLLYVVWAYIGKLLVGRYAYWFFDFSKLSWEHVLVSIVAFVSLAEIFFAVTYGITGLRETATIKSERRGYTRLPQ